MEDNHREENQPEENQPEEQKEVQEDQQNQEAAEEENGNSEPQKVQTPDDQKSKEEGLNDPGNSKQNRKKRELMYMDQQNIIREGKAQQKQDSRLINKFNHSRMLNFFQKQKQDRSLDFKQMRKNLDSHKIPAEIENLFPNKVKIYEKMRDLEDNINTFLKQKILSVKEDLLQSNGKVKRNLRVMSEIEKAGLAWTLRLEGRVLDLPQEEQLGKQEDQNAFLNFFEKVEIEFPDKTYPPVEWVKAKSDSSDFDRIEISRNVKPEQTNLRINIKLYLENNPKKYKLSYQLSELLGIEEETRLRIVGALWQYIKSNRLQDSENRELIINNNEMIQVFGQEKIEFNQIIQKIQNHIFNIDPLELKYELDFAKEEKVERHFYNIPVCVQSNLAQEQIDFLVNCNYDFFNYSNEFVENNQNVQKLALNGNVLKKREAKYNIKISNNIEKMKKNFRQMKFFDNLNRDFNKSIQDVLIEQNKLLQILSDEQTPVYDTFPDFDNAQFFLNNQNWIVDEIDHYFKGKDEALPEFQDQMVNDAEIEVKAESLVDKSKDNFKQGID